MYSLTYLYIARLMESEVAVLRLWCYTSMPNHVRLKNFLWRGGKFTEPESIIVASYDPDFPKDFNGQHP